MDLSNTPSHEPSRTTTPNQASNSRFISQNATAEDMLRSQTVGLVNLSDFRKRRAEALDGSLSASNSGTSTPATGGESAQLPSKKPKRKAKPLLSFGGSDDDDDDRSATSAISSRRGSRPPADHQTEHEPPNVAATTTLRQAENTSLASGPKLVSKVTKQREAEEKAKLAREFYEMQSRVKKTDIIIPFVFFDGANTNGGKVRIKKEDQLWLFLDKARRMGAALSVGGERGRKEWARVNVNDLMIVREDVIFPPHLDFYYFIINKTKGFKGQVIFDFSDKPTKGTPEPLEAEDQPVDPATYNPLLKSEKTQTQPKVPDEELEGFNDDPKLTRVVDSRWYQRNKHIFPASTWVEFDPSKDFSKVQRTDASGNTFFLS